MKLVEGLWKDRDVGEPGQRSRRSKSATRLYSNHQSRRAMVDWLDRRSSRRQLPGNDPSRTAQHPAPCFTRVAGYEPVGCQGRSWTALHRSHDLTMKRRDLIRYVMQSGCRLVRECDRHSWWENVVQRKRSAVPRHTEIDERLVLKICQDLGIDPPQ
jgi:mRNA interferase HicA